MCIRDSINGAAKSGDDFIVLSNEKEAKSLCEARVEESKDDKIPLNFVTQDSAFQSTVSEELNIIIKSDVHGSSEAIKNAIDQIKHDEVKPKILLSDIGMVTETDIALAKASNAVVIAFNVKPSKEAKKRAEQEKISISTYNIIYEVLDFIKRKMGGLLSPDVEEKIIGSAEILEIFKVSKVGKVAGSKVVEGEITQNSKLIEATSGNTGIALAMAGADLGLPVTIVMPSNMSEERKQMMRSYGAEIIDAPPGDFEAAINMKKQMLIEDRDLWSPNQFENPTNIECHFLTTAHEIHKQAGPSWAAFVHGAGTGGTIMGVKQYIDSFGLDVKVCLVTPAEEKHNIQGIGDGRDFLVDREKMDSVSVIATQDAVNRAKKIAS